MPKIIDPWQRRVLEYNRESAAMLASMDAADADQQARIADLERSRREIDERRRETERSEWESR